MKHSSNAGRPEAAAAIWDWKSGDDLDQPVTPASTLRRQGMTQGGIAIAMGGLLYYFELPHIAYVASGVGSCVALIALASPTRLFATLQRAVDSLGQRVGNLLAWILLPSIFYLFFAPFGLLLRSGDRDTLRRRLEPEARSYWIKRDPEAPARGSRERQF